MTISEVIILADKLKPNKFPDELKIKWLNVIEKTVISEVMYFHLLTDEETAAYEAYEGYDAETPQSTVLLVPDPYSELYLYWLLAQIDLNNGELGKYNNSVILYNNALSNFADHFNRIHTTVGLSTHITL